MDQTHEQQPEQNQKDGKYILHIENFEGPLDLLWNLIKKAKIDIIDVSISDITEQYIAYLKLMDRLNISVASEFIAMASELLYYKSKALLPTGEIEDEYFIPPLPPELVQRLLEYKKYQLSSLQLREKFDQQSDCFARESDISQYVDNNEYTTMSLFDLLNAFVDVLGSQKEIEEKEIIFDEILVSDRIDFILDLLKDREKIGFYEIFSEHPSKAEIVSTFLAMLELSKMQRVKIMQHNVFGTIDIFRNFDPGNSGNPDNRNIDEITSVH
jgi:segregation and condensation protein A